ncbi:MAG TPA: hypothetical protein VD838_01450 [Anaeromyxobacteraceae bacterium]|nr:hypothetical protein [Anaeromyxobacteraceae bacterium]
MTPPALGYSAPRPTDDAAVNARLQREADARLDAALARQFSVLPRVEGGEAPAAAGRPREAPAAGVGAEAKVSS